MKASKKRARGFRSPFVVTVATLAGAMATACGGSVRDSGVEGSGGASGGSAGNTGGAGIGGSGHFGGNPRGGAGGSGGSVIIGGSGGVGGFGGDAGSGLSGTGGSNKPPPVVCAFPETPGTPCAIEGQVCPGGSADASNGCVSTTNYLCQGGVWVATGTTCNPVPPLETCPMTMPAAGTVCHADPQLSCPYVTSYCCGAPAGQSYFSCVLGQWEATATSVSTCNPPAVVCPGSPPENGTPCGNSCSTYGYCTYPTGCGQTSYVCSGGHWQWQNGCDAGLDAPLDFDAAPADAGSLDDGAGGNGGTL